MVEPRQLLGLVPHGLYLIGVLTDSDRFIYTGSWLTQASFEPCLIVTAVRRNHPGNAMIQEAGTFTVNFLATGQLDLARVGFGNPDDRFAGLEWERCPETGGPVVMEAIGYIGCRLVRWVEGGDHDLAIAEAVTAKKFREGKLLTIHDTPWTYS